MRKVLILFLVIFSFLWPDEVDTMRDKVDIIERDIRKNELNINAAIEEEKSLIKQIDKISEELSTIKKSYYEAEKKYQTINKNVNYAEQNLQVIDKEIYESTRHFEDTIYKYDEYLYLNKENLFLDEYSMDNYFEAEEMKDVLGNTYDTIENINLIKSEVREIKDEISSEREELNVLRRELANKKYEIERKQREQNNLIRQLKNNQAYYKNQIDKLRKEKLAVEKDIENIIREKARLSGEYNTAVILKELGFIMMPSDGKVKVNFGQEKSPEIISAAMEIKSTLGDRIKAANRGEVIFVGKLNNLGNVVMISHGYNLTTVYGNLISSYVTVGDVVAKGQAIGVLGFSSSREPVLYFETRLGTKSVDPRIFLSK